MIQMGIIKTMDWFGLSLLYVIFMSAFYYLSKKLLNRSEIDPRIFGGLMNLGVGIVTLPIAILAGFSFRFTPASVGLLCVLGLIITLAASLYYTGLKNVDLSTSMVLEGFQVFSTLLFGFWFFGEELSTFKVAAALFVFVAIWRVSGQSTSLRLNKYEIFILLSTVFYSLAAMLDKYFVGYSNPFTYLTLGFFSVGLVMTSINLPRWKQHAGMFSAYFFRSLLIICFVIAAAYSALFSAYEHGEVSRIAVIIQSQVILTVILGIFFLKETNALWEKFSALVLLVIGLYLVSF